MKTEHLVKFIRKYHLDGLIEKVHWITTNGHLRVAGCCDDKRLLAIVTWRNFNALPDSDIGISNTRLLLKRLRNLKPDGVSLAIEKDESGGGMFLSLSDAHKELGFSLADLHEMENVPYLKTTPIYNAEIKLDDDFVKAFRKASSSYSEYKLFAVVPSSKRSDTLDIVIGNPNGNRITIQDDTVNGQNTLSGPLWFRSKSLKAILRANSKCKNRILKIADAGVASISFSHDDVVSNYHLCKYDVQ